MSKIKKTDFTEDHTPSKFNLDIYNSNEKILIVLIRRYIYPIINYINHNRVLNKFPVLKKVPVLKRLH